MNWKDLHETVKSLIVIFLISAPVLLSLILGSIFETVIEPGSFSTFLTILNLVLWLPAMILLTIGSQLIGLLGFESGCFMGCYPDSITGYIFIVIFWYLIFTIIFHIRKRIFNRQ